MADVKARHEVGVGRRDRLADIAVVRAGRAGVFGLVASDPTVTQTIDTGRVLPSLD